MNSVGQLPTWYHYANCSSREAQLCQQQLGLEVRPAKAHGTCRTCPRKLQLSTSSSAWRSESPSPWPLLQQKRRAEVLQLDVYVNAAPSWGCLSFLPPGWLLKRSIALSASGVRSPGTDADSAQELTRLQSGSHLALRALFRMNMAVGRTQFLAVVGLWSPLSP